MARCYQRTTYRISRQVGRISIRMLHGRMAEVSSYQVDWLADEVAGAGITGNC